MPERDLRQRFRDRKKMSLVAESWDLEGKEMGMFLRSHGISSCELMDWKAQMMDGLTNGKVMSRSEKKSLLARIAKLETELDQAKFLIEAQKKIQGLFAKSPVKKLSEKSEGKSLSSMKRLSKEGLRKKPSAKPSK